MTRNKYCELLAPAGSSEALRAAVNAGADAVYVGSSKYSARAYAQNPDIDELLPNIDYAHRYGVKVYLAVNTLLKNREMDELISHLSPYYNAGVDAIIVQDMGVLKAVRDHLPLLPIHASTQMTITGKYGCMMAKSLGASRVVLAREVSLEEIRDIKRSCDIELEVFVHGAMCYAYSGQCLMSSLIGGRSGNRGRCAGTCRLCHETKDSSGKWQDSYPLSMKDLCSIEILPDIIEAGASSLKIEGRMKNACYTAGVVEIWRKYIDLYYAQGRDGFYVEKKDIDILNQLFDRGGQTEGYFHDNSDMVAISGSYDFRKDNTGLYEGIKQKYLDNIKQIDICASLTLKVGEPLAIKIRDASNLKSDIASSIEYEEKELGQGIEYVASYIVEKANKKIDIERIKEKIRKTGGTGYNIVCLDIDADEDAFVPMSILNETRRAALAMFDEKILSKYRRDEAATSRKPLGEEGFEKMCDSQNGCHDDSYVDCKSHDKIDDEENRNEEKSDEKNKLLVSCETVEQARVAMTSPHVGAIYIPVDIKQSIDDAYVLEISQIKKLVEGIHANGKKAYLYMPHIFRKIALDYFTKNKDEIFGINWDGFVIRNIDEMGYIKSRGEGRELIFDHTMYAMNDIAASSLFDMGASRLTFPLEANARELEHFSYEADMLVYGRYAMMVSAQCTKKNLYGCDGRDGLSFIKDRKSNLLPVRNRCTFCYNTILNPQITSAIGIARKLEKIHATNYRMDLTIEDEEETKKAIEAVCQAFMEHLEVNEPMETFTRGHLNRGVE